MITSKEWGAEETTIAMRREYDDAARAFCKSVARRKSNNMIVVNFDTKESFDSVDKFDAWRIARENWGPNIAHPPVYTISNASKAP